MFRSSSDGAFSACISLVSFEASLCIAVFFFFVSNSVGVYSCAFFSCFVKFCLNIFNFILLVLNLSRTSAVRCLRGERYFPFFFVCFNLQILILRRLLE